ncbi:hypothetical protein Forpe1208_v016270 [Fusarium oxysporum f. sp. rapae]|uniref:Uncharacterized protein n=1 Tax=Fusarium oxysporum f. sp. rapae TaxID=485398 RepID=A0A8J5NFK1_FUSOX|nr:hypothetical protein Forpe1208_v016270 [Fusarium oxysporum f. sp. rapae]
MGCSSALQAPRSATSGTAGFPSLRVLDENDVQLALSGGNLYWLVGLRKRPSSMLMRRHSPVAVYEFRQLLAEVGKPAQHVVLVRVLGPSLPTVRKEWITALDALVKERLGGWVKAGHTSKVCIMEATESGIHRPKFRFQRVVYVFAMFGRVCESCLYCAAIGSVGGKKLSAREAGWIGRQRHRLDPNKGIGFDSEG